VKIAGIPFGFILVAAATLAPSPAFAKRAFSQDGWRLVIRDDRFTGQIACRLSSTNHHMRYQPGAVGFFVGHRHDTLAAWYRVDGGAPVRWQDRSAALIAAGVKIDSPDLDDVTGGWIWIPVDEVQRASLVAIRPGDRARTRHFHLRGFAAMREAATRLGCSSNDIFRL
jgi:hypothetical protein